ncbi:MAG: sodium:solute symporter family protein, partial [Longimicrobiales bacterium]
WVVVAVYGVVTLLVGLVFTKRAGRSLEQYFLSGRKLPWWLLGTSMVATTFSTDTPNLVTDLVRSGGVSMNWLWWAFLITGMLTVFFYAKLWRRSGALTDINFYELRYSGAPAAFLRGFRAIYLGVFFNVMIMAAVTLAAIKIGGVLLGISPVAMVVLAGGATVVFSMAGGLRGVLITDFLLFFVALFGSIVAAAVALAQPEVGGLGGLLAHPDVGRRIALLPDFADRDALVTLLILPLAVQWWSVWYPGSEPGGGGYVAQRMLSARTERDATSATLLFNAAHYALRPWPWIIVALASLIVFPTLESLRDAFPSLPPGILGHDLAYPAMLTLLPAGLLGLVIASLAAAYMSTISTHLNWGASYVVNDVWQRFIEPRADQRRLVWVGRTATVLLMVLASLMALWLDNALQAFQILLQIGAGTGLLFLLRWFWWRINAFSEITAMVVSFFVALYLELVHPQLFGATIGTGAKLVIGVGITTAAWVTVTVLTPPTSAGALERFYRLATPGGPGWRPVIERARAGGRDFPDSGRAWTVPAGLLAAAAGCLAVYSALFGIGNLLYGRYALAAALLVAATAAAVYVVRVWGRVSGEAPLHQVEPRVTAPAEL